MQKNVRLVKMGDVIRDEEGEVQVVRNTTMILHLANGTDLPVDCPGSVEALDASEVEQMDEVRDQIQMVESAE